MPARLLLWEPLPLRTTRMLGDYSVNEPLPEVFGDLSAAPFPLIRLTSTRYLAADHPMEITGVFIDRQATAGYERVLTSDADNHTWTEVRFAAPVLDSVAVSATGKGKRHPDTGELLQNPADIAERIMRIGGRDDDFSALRAEASRFAITVAGRITGLDVAIKDHVDVALQSVGAIWCPGMARLYPSPADPSPILDLDKSEADPRTVTVTASLVDTADVLRLSYDQSDASGKPLHYIEMSASPHRYGGLSKEIAYPMLRTPANAEAIGRAVLQRLAGERYSVAFQSSNRALRPGMWVRLVDNPGWMIPGDDPVIMVHGVGVDPQSSTVSVTGETLIGTPLVTVTAHSIALPDTVEAGLDVSVRDGVATFTATDEAGRPLAGARISLDGGAPKTTDQQGRASFTLAFGQEGQFHEVAFEAPGFDTQILQVLL